MDQSNLYNNEVDKKHEILSDDSPLNGQNWVCLSFVSPESIVQDKHGFTVAKFLQSYAKEKDLEFEKLYEDYNNFKYKYSDKLDKDYSEKNNNQTNIRGLKVRGVYPTNEEAKNRASLLHKTDPSFHVFVGTVGQWLPWDPSADSINDEVFLEETLNNLVSEYKKQSTNRDSVFSDRMDDQRTIPDKSISDQSEYGMPIQVNNNNLQSLAEEDDTWIKQKIDDSEDTEPNDIEIVDDPVKESSDPVKESSDPVKESSDPVQESSDPVQESSDPVKESSDKKVD